MGKTIYLQISDYMKKTTEINYEDLLILYRQFIDTYGHVPTVKEMNSVHNMPQQRIIMRVLNENNITYNDLLNKFGKVKHVRTENKELYDEYVKKFKEVSNECGRALKQNELINNNYGLPSYQWLINNCPDKSITTYQAFCEWCGFKSNVLKNEKEEIDKKLIQLEKELNRSITRSDISKDKTGFSMIVINRLYGGLNNAKKELGLMKAPSFQPKPFEYYKGIIDKAIEIIKETNITGIVTWQDFESITIGEQKIKHKTILRAFRNNNVDFLLYLKDHGLLMSSNSFNGLKYIFDDGEKVLSSYEYKVSEYLRKLGYKYKDTYDRDIMYRLFLPYDEKRKINCDYVINNNKYIEVAGVISNKYNDWETHVYTHNTQKTYQEKMIHKKELLEDNQKDYLFLFPEDFIGEIYKEKIDALLDERKEKIA